MNMMISYQELVRTFPRFDDAVCICKNELTELTYAEVEQFIEKLKQYQVKV